MGRGDLYEDRTWKYRIRDVAALVSLGATLIILVFGAGSYLVLQYRVGEAEQLARRNGELLRAHELRESRLLERLDHCCPSGGK